MIANGQARGVLPGGHELLVTRARSVALREADLVIVAGTPLDFRLGYGSFGPRRRRPGWCTWPTRPAGSRRMSRSPRRPRATCPRSSPRWPRRLTGADPDWAPGLAEAVRAGLALDGPLLASDADPVHPARIYGELLKVLDDDAVVIGDGGDFVSFAGKYIEPKRPGGWLDPGPFGCLGTGLGYAIAARLARPSAQVVLLLGDGAAGFSLMDADTLVRHGLPVVIICGNNAGWGLERHPMRALYGYDVAADLQPGCRYDEVVRALGGAGELVTAAADIAPALRRAFASDVPYLVNVVTDPEVAYPRSTTGVLGRTESGGRGSDQADERSRPRLRGAGRSADARLADAGDQVAFLDHVALGDVHLGDHAGAFGQDRDLHLHRLEDHQGVTVVDVIAFRRDHLPHVRDHLRADFSHR